MKWNKPIHRHYLLFYGQSMLLRNLSRLSEYYLNCHCKTCACYLFWCVCTFATYMRPSPYRWSYFLWSTLWCKSRVKLYEYISCSTSSSCIEKLRLLFQCCAQIFATHFLELSPILSVKQLSLQKASRKSASILKILNEDWITTLQITHVLSYQLLSDTEICPIFYSAIGKLSYTVNPNINCKKEFRQVRENDDTELIARFCFNGALMLLKRHARWNRQNCLGFCFMRVHCLALYRKQLYIISRKMQKENIENMIWNDTAFRIISGCYQVDRPLYCELAPDFIPKRALTSHREFLLLYWKILVQAELPKENLS